MDEEMLTRWLTCHTDGCSNAEQPIEMTYPADVSAHVCGVCSTPINDVAEQPPEPVTEMPTWDL